MIEIREHRNDFHRRLRSPQQVSFEEFEKHVNDYLDEYTASLYKVYR